MQPSYYVDIVTHSTAHMGQLGKFYIASICSIYTDSRTICDRVPSISCQLYCIYIYMGQLKTFHTCRYFLTCIIDCTLTRINAALHIIYITTTVLGSFSSRYVVPQKNNHSLIYMLYNVSCSCNIVHLHKDEKIHQTNL